MIYPAHIPWNNIPFPPRNIFTNFSTHPISIQVCILFSYLSIILSFHHIITLLFPRKKVDSTIFHWVFPGVFNMLGKININPNRDYGSNSSLGDYHTAANNIEQGMWQKMLYVRPRCRTNWIKGRENIFST